MKKTQPIGVFDSGVGGLHTLSYLQDHLPKEDFIYIADSKYFPYGNKSAVAILKRVSVITNYFIQLGVKAIVIACNSASSHSEEVKKYSPIPIFDVITPTAKYALQQSQSKKIALLGTNRTIEAGVYEKILKQSSTVFPLACPDFVTLVENGDIADSQKTLLVVDEQLTGLKNQGIDTMILGCTHFHYLKKDIHQVMGNITLVECNEPVYAELHEYLKQHKLFNNQSCNGKITLLTSQKSEQFDAKIHLFYHQSSTMKEIDL